MLVATLPLPAAEGRYFDILAANPPATALSPRLAVGRNRLRDVFLDPAEKDLYLDWESVTERLVAIGEDSESPWKAARGRRASTAATAEAIPGCAATRCTVRCSVPSSAQGQEPPPNPVRFTGRSAEVSSGIGISP